MALTLSKHVGVRNHVIMACRLQRSRMRLAECATMPLHSLRFVDPPRRHTVIFTRCFSQCSPCLPRWVPWPCRSSKSPAIITAHERRCDRPMPWHNPRRQRSLRLWNQLADHRHDRLHLMRGTVLGKRQHHRLSKRVHRV